MSIIGEPEMFTVDGLDPKSFLKTVNFMLTSGLRVKSKQRVNRFQAHRLMTPIDLANYIIVFEML